MSNRKRRLRHLANRDKEPHWLCFLPLMLILGLVPIIVHARLTPLTEIEQIIFQGQSFHIDFFHFYKSVWFVVLTLLSVVSLAHLNYLGIRTLSKRRWFIPLGIYLALVFISFLNSDDFVVGWRGFATSYQGLPVYLSYGVLIFVVYHMVKTKRDSLLFIWPLLIMALVMTVVSASQYFAGPQFNEHPFFGPVKDVLSYEWVVNLITPEHIDGVRITMTLGWAYGTLYNPNFAGSFGVMVAFLGIAFYFLSSKLTHKLLMTVVILCGLFIMIASNSRAGFVGLVGAVGVWFVIGLPYLLRTHKLTLMFIVVLMVSTVYGVDQLSEGRYRLQLLRIVEGLERQEQVQIREVSLDGFNAHILTDEAYVKLSWTGTQLLFYDEDGQFIPFTIEGTTYRLHGEAYESFSFQLQTNQARVRARFHGRLLDLYFLNEGFGVVGVGGLNTVTQNPQRVEFLRGYERVFSARGYIYSVSIPLIRNTWFIGSGPDHYVLEFPQRDIAGRLNGFGLQTVLDKPHNMFLQFALEIGLLGLIALLSLLVWPIASLLKGWFKPSPHAMYFVSLVAGVTGMLVSGLANDLIMSIAPLFIIIFGLLMTDLKEKEVS